MDKQINFDAEEKGGITPLVQILLKDSRLSGFNIDVYRILKNEQTDKSTEFFTRLYVSGMFGKATGLHAAQKAGGYYTFINNLNEEENEVAISKATIIADWIHENISVIVERVRVFMAEFKIPEATIKTEVIQKDSATLAEKIILNKFLEEGIIKSTIPKSNKSGKI